MASGTRTWRTHRLVWWGVALAVVVAGTAAVIMAGGRSAGPWDSSPGVFEVNRLAASARTVPQADVEAAIAADSSSPWLQSLNGQWEFAWSPSLDAAPADFWKPSADTSAWDTVEVPHQWQLDGYGSETDGDIVYLNEAHPWQGDARIDPPRIPTDGASIGSYRRIVQVPDAWDGRRTVLAFQGVKSALTVWVNGVEVGYSEDSYTPAEFDITDAVVPGDNLIAVRVHRWSDGSWLENQDQIDLSGIFRDVEMYSTPTTYLHDYTVTTDVGDDGASAQVRVEAEVAGELAPQASLVATLYGPDGDALGTTTTTGAVRADSSGADHSGAITVETPRLWTAETPHLYSLVWELAGPDGVVTQTVGTRVGIREFAIVDGVMTLNGRRLDIKGVNRGEMHPDVGQAMTEELIRADLTAMKRANITAVRLSHYPAHPALYALADEIGLYLMDEANVESHDQRPFPGNAPAWSDAVLDRVISMYERDKNHASVLWWSLGNEAGGGQVFEDAAAWLRDADPTRLVHYQDDSSVADIDGVFYPSVSDVRARAQEITGRPWIMSEYQMVMGNAVAGMREMWEAIDSNPEMQGGFIWDWADQAIRVPIDGGFASLPVGDRADTDTYLSYGGDWGDGAHDGGFSLNGLVNPDRVAQPELAAVAATYAPFTLETATMIDGVTRVCNESLVRDLRDYDVTWVREIDGVEVASGILDWDLAAGQCATFDLPASATSMEGAKSSATVATTVTVALAAETAWAPRGHVVAQAQAVLRDGAVAGVVPDVSAGALTRTSDEGIVRVSGERVDVRVDEATGVVTTAVLDGVTVVQGGIVPDFWRAPTQNDLMNGLADGAYTWQEAVREPDAVEISAPDEATVVIESTYTLAVAGAPGARLTTSIRADGTVEVVMAYEGSQQAREIPAVGTALTLPGDLSEVSWFGDGPGAAYRDRTEGTRLGRWSSTVEASLFPHVVPQADGNHTNVRWFAATDADGQGVLVTAVGQTVEASALPASDGAISAARHPHEVVRDGRTHVAIDAAQAGVGFTWGENPVPGYSVNADQPRTVHMVLSALQAGDMS